MHGLISRASAAQTRVRMVRQARSAPREPLCQVHCRIALDSLQIAEAVTLALCEWSALLRLLSQTTIGGTDTGRFVSRMKLADSAPVSITLLDREPAPLGEHPVAPGATLVGRSACQPPRLAYVDGTQPRRDAPALPLSPLREEVQPIVRALLFLPGQVLKIPAGVPTAIFFQSWNSHSGILTPDRKVNSPELDSWLRISHAAFLASESSQAISPSAVHSEGGRAQ